MLQIERYIVNMVQENSYLLWDESGEACVIDPGFMTDKNLDTMRKTLQEQHLTLRRCLATHRHFDHYLGAERVQKEWGIIVEIPQQDIDELPCMEEQMRVLHVPSFTHVTEPDMQPLQLEPNGTIHFGNTTLQVISTPGHTPGHVSYYSEASDGALFCGDVLFKGDYGRYDLWGGSYEQLMHSIREKLLPLPEHTIIYPGHGSATTIEAERRNHQ